MSNYSAIITQCKHLNKSTAKQVLLFCYDDLPSKYRSCLLYLTIFPQDQVIRATSLARRCIVEGLIATSTELIAWCMQRKMEEPSYRNG